MRSRKVVGDAAFQEEERVLQERMQQAKVASARYQNERMVEQRRRIVEAEAKPTYAERVEAWMALAADRLLSEEMGYGYPTSMAQVWATMHLAEVMERKPVDVEAIAQRIADHTFTKAETQRMMEEDGPL